MKQLGADPVQFAVATEMRAPVGSCELRLKSHKGNDPSEWPEDLRVREFPYP